MWKLFVVLLCSVVHTPMWGISATALASLRTAKQEIEALIKQFSRTDDKNAFYEQFEQKLQAIEKLDSQAAQMYRKQVPKQKAVITSVTSEIPKVDAPPVVPSVEPKPQVVESPEVHTEIVEKELPQEVPLIKDEKKSETSWIDTLKKPLLYFGSSSMQAEDEKLNERTIAFAKSKEVINQIERVIKTIKFDQLITEKSAQLQNKKFEDWFKSIDEHDKKCNEYKKSKALKQQIETFEKEIDGVERAIIDLIQKQINRSIEVATAIITPYVEKFEKNKELIESKWMGISSDHAKFDPVAYAFFWGDLKDDEWKDEKKRKKLDWFTLVTKKQLLHDLIVHGVVSAIGLILLRFQNSLATTEKLQEELEPLIKKFEKAIDVYSKDLAESYQGMKRIQEKLEYDDQQKQVTLLDTEYGSYLQLITKDYKTLHDLRLGSLEKQIDVNI